MKQTVDRENVLVENRRKREAHNVFSRLPAIYATSRTQGQRLLQHCGGLSIVEWRTLWDLNEVGAVSIRDLAKIQRTDHSLLSRALPDMKRKGFVEMRRSEVDARQMLVELTDIGRAAYEEAAPIMRSRREALRKKFTTEEIEEFVGYLDRLEDFFNIPIENIIPKDSTE